MRIVLACSENESFYICFISLLSVHSLYTSVTCTVYSHSHITFGRRNKRKLHGSNKTLKDGLCLAGPRRAVIAQSKLHGLSAVKPHELAVRRHFDMGGRRRVRIVPFFPREKRYYAWRHQYKMNYSDVDGRKRLLQ